MVIELQLVLHTIAQVPQYPNVVDRSFAQGSVLSRPASCLCIHHIIFLIFVRLVLVISSTRFNLHRYGWIPSVHSVSSPEGCHTMAPHIGEIH